MDRGVGLASKELGYLGEAVNLEKRYFMFRLTNFDRSALGYPIGSWKCKNDTQARG